jgi:uncharacterized protein
LADIHKFIKGKDYYVIDVNSGTVHIVDELVYDILDDDRLKTLDEVFKSIGDKYKKEDIEEAYSEIQHLVDEGMLYSKDLYKDVAIKNDNTPSYIKALCLNIAHDCNLRCKYCFADEANIKEKGNLCLQK